MNFKQNFIYLNFIGNNGTIELSEYLTYHDVISNGTLNEKRDQNFRMFNLDQDSRVTYQEFESFTAKILDMYSRTNLEEIGIDEGRVRKIFNEIATDGKDYFTFPDYTEALDKNPDLFIWLESPKEMLNDILNEQESEYSKQFVDDTLDLSNKYVSSTENAINQILIL